MLFFCAKILFCNLRCFVVKSVLLQFTRLCVEKNSATNCACGENMTIMRYAHHHDHHYHDHHDNYHDHHHVVRSCACINLPALIARSVVLPLVTDSLLSKWDDGDDDVDDDYDEDDDNADDDDHAKIHVVGSIHAKAAWGKHTWVSTLILPHHHQIIWNNWKSRALQASTSRWRPIGSSLSSSGLLDFVLCPLWALRLYNGDWALPNGYCEKPLDNWIG